MSFSHIATKAIFNFKCFAKGQGLAILVTYNYYFSFQQIREPMFTLELPTLLFELTYERPALDLLFALLLSKGPRKRQPGFSYLVTVLII